MQLEADKLCFGYNRKESYLLNNISLTFKEGEKVAIVGPSGYGKSTLAKLLSGYLAPVKGRVLLDGKPLNQKGVCPVQLIYQHPEKAINPRFRMRQVLEEAKGLDQTILKKIGIEEEWLTRFPRELSGGELQRF
ncbi:ATP-binding cassette domain-containing protein, partial [Anaerosporobacter sp.]|uniref:ATP-binding cassette domain-containing protein n=1 Tax=Anaerosporobacter sp. TaxID=1872529 RepID=UPI0028A061B5